jgi:DNA-binding NarL/FixJ family response regulator
LVVTSDDEVRDLSVELFQRAGIPSRDVDTGADAIIEAGEQPPAMVLLDLDLEDMNGYGACYQMREVLGDEPIIIAVSGKHTTAADRAAGIRIGANDFLTKPFDPDELLARTRRFLVRTANVPPVIDTELTAREIQVLQLLAQGHPQDTIAKELFISGKTVATHIQRIITKLGVHSRTEAVALAYQSGLVSGASAAE